MTESCSPLVHVASGATIFTLLLRRRVTFFHRTATSRPVFKPWASLLPTYRKIEWCLEFLSHLNFLFDSHSYKWVSLGNFATAQIDSANMRHFHSIHLGTGL